MITINVVNGPRRPWYRVESADFSLRMLTPEALDYFLKHQLKMSKVQRNGVYKELLDYGTLTLELVAAAVAS